MAWRDYDIIILEEANVAAKRGLISVNDLVKTGKYGTGDVAIGISTSGNSKNVIKAIETAKDKGLFTVVFTGRGGSLAFLADMVFAVESDITARIQEVHITLGHILCELVDRNLFPGKF